MTILMVKFSERDPEDDSIKAILKSKSKQKTGTIIQVIEVYIYCYEYRRAILDGIGGQRVLTASDRDDHASHCSEQRLSYIYWYEYRHAILDGIGGQRVLTASDRDDHTSHGNIFSSIASLYI